MAYAVSLKQFDGPLDLLLTLIREAKIDIKEIFVSQITEQYLEYMRGVDELDMDSASEFLEMAATLLEIKSRALVPNIKKEDEENEESPEALLIRRLEEYKAFKELTQDMRKLEDEAKALYTKLPEEFPLPSPEIELTGLTTARLWAAFQRVMARAEARDAATRPSQREIRRDVHTVRDCMARIARRVRRGRAGFSSLFGEKPTREEVVTVFLALLELLKLNRVRVRQKVNYDEIWIEAVKA